MFFLKQINITWKYFSWQPNAFYQSEKNMMASSLLEKTINILKYKINWTQLRQWPN